MKKLIARALSTLAIFSLATAGALAGDQKNRIKLSEDISVSGSPVEAGSYDVAFDQESGELSIKKGGKVVAKAKASVEQASSKARSTTYTVASENGARVLRSVAFAGGKRVVVSESGGGAVSGSNQ